MLIVDSLQCVHLETREQGKGTRRISAVHLTKPKRNEPLARSPLSSHLPCEVWGQTAEHYGRASSMMRHKTPLWHLSAVSYPLLLPSASSSVFINFTASGGESGRYICRLTLDLWPGSPMTRLAGGLVCLITNSPYRHRSTSRPLWWRRKPDTALNFISSGHMVCGEKKIRDETRAFSMPACSLSLSLSRFLCCHSLLTDFCEPSLSW